MSETSGASVERFRIVQALSRLPNADRAEWCRGWKAGPMPGSRGLPDETAWEIAAALETIEACGAVVETFLPVPDCEPLTTRRPDPDYFTKSVRSTPFGGASVADLDMQDRHGRRWGL